MSRLSSALVLVALAVAVMFVACDTDDEEVGSGGPTADEVIERVSAAMAGVGSYKTEAASITNQYFSIDLPGLPSQEPQGPQLEYTITIVAGEDMYDDHLYPADACTDFDEPCLTSVMEGCRADACDRYAFSESLWFGGTYYHRAASGTWIDGDSQSGCDGSSCWDSVSISDTSGYLIPFTSACDSNLAPTIIPSEVPLAAMYLSLLVDPQRLDDVTLEGTSLIHLRGKPFDPLSWTPPPGCELPSVTIAPEDQEIFDLFSKWLPDKIDGVVDLWVDPSTYLPARMLSDSSTYNADGDLVQRDLSLSLFSDYNTAELPGPLPAH